jgi:hypothetical protein
LIWDVVQKLKVCLEDSVEGLPELPLELLVSRSLELPIALSIYIVSLNGGLSYCATLSVDLLGYANDMDKGVVLKEGWIYNVIGGSPESRILTL